MKGPGVRKARPTIEMVKRALEERGLLEGVRVAAAVHHVAVADICGRDRSAAVAAARASVWRCLRAAGLSFPEIGRLFGRNHTTVLQVLNPRPRATKEAKAS